MQNYVVMDRKEVAETIHSVMRSGRELLEKDKLEQSDFGKLKVMKSMSNSLNSAVAMIQQETAQQRIEIVRERMKQLGFSIPPEQLKAPVD